MKFLEREISCRDPFSEFSEIIVAQLKQATHASSRVQKGYDLISKEGKFIQVKYLSNPDNKWINEHPIVFDEDLSEYALVIFVGLKLESIIIFPRETLGKVCRHLGKKHPKQETTLQFTQRNYKMILDNEDTFASFGVEVFQFS